MKLTEKNELDTLATKLSEMAISFESGDVMALSDIMDVVEKLQIVSDELLHSIVIALLELCKRELKKENAGFVKLFSNGIDYFKDILDTEGVVQDWKKQRALDWIVLSKKETVLEEVSSTDDKKQTVVNDARVEIPVQEDIVIDMEQFGTFFSDCEERFSRAQELILLLEEDLENMEYIQELFRVFHTIKGECGFLKLTSLGFLTHNIENLLDLLRSDKMKADARVIEYLLQGLDLSISMLDDIKKGSVIIENKQPLGDYVETLTRFTTQSKPSLGSILVSKGVISEEDKNEIIKEQINSGFEKKFGEVAIEKNIISQENLQKTLQEQQQTQQNNQKDSVSDETTDKPTTTQDTEKKKVSVEAIDPIIKVKTSKVNYLVDMIGELLISMGQIQENIPELASVRKIARQLQYAGMQLRTESVKMLFGTVKRIIRDTSNKLNKPVLTDYIGEELEIDRLLIENLEEPLMHLVRNALDHGIESQEEREKLGKNPLGTVRVAAERRGNNIVISVGDDGRGLSREKILEKAISKGLVKEEEAESMTDMNVCKLIFLPGFSTKDKVDYISGRGVGMDIIKQAITKNKGRIEIVNHPGNGTTFEMFFPLSTAIIDGMAVRTGKNIFIIPISLIIESLRIKDENVNKIREGVRVLNLRGDIIPLISIEKVFGVPDAGAGQMATIVENSNRERYAIISDEIIAKREIVIKSLGAKFRNFKGISSGTVLAGGTIGLVIDVDQFIELGTEGHPTGEFTSVFNNELASEELLDDTK